VDSSAAAISISLPPVSATISVSFSSPLSGDLIAVFPSFITEAVCVVNGDDSGGRSEPAAWFTLTVLGWT
jgi:hypothetical protein